MSACRSASAPVLLAPVVPDEQDPRWVDHRRHLLEGRPRRTERTKAEGLLAAQLMTAPVITIGPEASLGQAARLMHEKRVRRLPVVEEEARSWAS
jgi:CBS domain-containing protein